MANLSLFHETESVLILLNATNGGFVYVDKPDLQPGQPTWLLDHTVPDEYRKVMPCDHDWVPDPFFAALVKELYPYDTALDTQVSAENAATFLGAIGYVVAENGQVEAAGAVNHRVPEVPGNLYNVGGGHYYDGVPRGNLLQNDEGLEEQMMAGDNNDDGVSEPDNQDEDNAQDAGPANAEINPSLLPSDGVATMRPPNVAPPRRAPFIADQAIQNRWKSKLHETMTLEGIKTQRGFPVNYTFYLVPRPAEATGEPKDKRLYGHPSGRPFTSPIKFAVHYKYLIELSKGSVAAGRCQCQCCA